MTRYVLSPGSSTLDIWTRKEGLLSRVAHDLQITASGLEGHGTIENGRFSLELSALVAMLAVRGAVHEGKTTPMSDKDRSEIETTMRGPAVLDAARFPRAVFTASGEGDPLAATGPVLAQGSLTLKGVTRPLTVPLRVTSANAPGQLQVTGEVSFRQTLFGIKPHSALFGTLKVQDELRISWALSLAPAPAATGATA